MLPLFQWLTTLPLFQEKKKPKSHYASSAQSKEVKELMTTCLLHIRDKLISCILLVLAQKNRRVCVLEERHLFEGFIVTGMTGGMCSVLCSMRYPA